MRPIASTSTILLLSTIVGCLDAPENPTAITAPAPAFAKAPPAPANPTTVVKIPLAAVGLAISSDGLYGDGAYSAYANGVCGVTSSILIGSSGDAIMQTNNPTAPDRKCVNAPRKWTLSYDDGFTETIPVFINLHELQSSTFALPVGGTVKRRLGINPTQNTRCDRLVWGESTGDSVLVTRTGTGSWEVQSQPAPNDRAWCSTTGVAYHMPIQFVLVTQ